MKTAYLSEGMKKEIREHGDSPYGDGYTLREFWRGKYVYTVQNKAGETVKVCADDREEALKKAKVEFFHRKVERAFS